MPKALLRKNLVYFQELNPYRLSLNEYHQDSENSHLNDLDNFLSNNHQVFHHQPLVMHGQWHLLVDEYSTLKTYLKTP